ncbi:MAG: 5-(carboxyamino)imidazole ribonucleotide synthase [Bacteroidota bacterium]
MNPFYHSSFQLGVLGGGQLGRMFIQEALNYNVSIHILDPDASAPCKDIASSFTNGKLTDEVTVLNFGKNKNLLTIEIEHVSVEALKKLEASGIPVYPQPHLLEMIQDKGLQKEFYKSNGIPTADFFIVNNIPEILQYASHFPFFQKLRKGGYDGRGVMKLTNPGDLSAAFSEPSVLEKMVDFEKEISVIVARNTKGEIAHFPVVECEFSPKANLVEFLFAPALLSPSIEKTAVEIARKVAEKMQIVGLLAVEMFVTKQGEVLVNEVAPRPHNSGHHTIEANVTSQYEQHLRAILGLPLGSTELIRPAVMVNLLGEEGHSGEAVYEGMEELMKMEGVFIHLYGKKHTRPFRKMGHVTVIGKTIDDAREKALIVKQKLKVVTTEKEKI